MSLIIKHLRDTSTFIALKCVVMIFVVIRFCTDVSVSDNLWVTISIGIYIALVLCLKTAALHCVPDDIIVEVFCIFG